MKKSKFYIKMNILAAASAAWGVLAYYVNMPSAAVICAILAFIAWYVPMQMPDYEKYSHEGLCSCEDCSEDITDEYYAEEQARIKQEEEIEAEAEASFHTWLAQDMLDNPEDHGLI